MNTIRNNVQLIGNAGAKPEIRTFENGNKMARLSLATTETFLNKNKEKVSETSWHNLVAWGRTAETIANLLDKGSQVAIEGKLLSRSYTDKEGIKRTMSEIVVNEFLLMNRKNQ